MARTKNKRSKSQNRRSKLNNRKSKRVLRGGSVNQLPGTNTEIVIDLIRPFSEPQGMKYELNRHRNEGYQDGEKITIQISDWIDMFKNGLTYTQAVGGSYTLKVKRCYHIDGGLPEPTPPYLEGDPLDKPVFRGYTLFKGDIINKVETHDGREGNAYRELRRVDGNDDEYRRRLMSAPYIRFTLNSAEHDKLAEEFQTMYKNLINSLDYKKQLEKLEKDYLEEFAHAMKILRKNSA